MFTIHNGDYTHTTVKTLTKDPAIALSKNTIGAIDITSGDPLVITADGTTAVAGKAVFILFDAPIGTTEVKCVCSEEAIFEGRATRPLTDADKGLEVDLAISSGKQVVDPDATTTDVFTIKSDVKFRDVREELVLGVPTMVEYVRFSFTKAAA
jgi:hypothetical protein